MGIRISYPHEAIADTKQFPDHHFSRDADMAYLGTHFKYDVYVQSKGQGAGNMYCVYGKDDGNYYSAVGYGLVRTNKPADGDISCYIHAAACALLRHPEYIPSVLKEHEG